MRRRLPDELVGVVMGGVWLVFLVFPVTELWWRGGLARLVGYPLLAVFVVVYLTMLTRFAPQISARQNRRQLALWAVLVAIMVALVLLLDASALMLSTYLVAVAVSGTREPSNYWLGAATVIAANAASWLLGQAPWQTGVVYTLVIYLVVGISVRASSQSMREQALAQENILVAERNRIATDVHDLLGHSLTVVKLKVQLVDRLLTSDPERARAELEDVRAIVDDALANVRRTVSLERARSLADEVATATESLRGAGIDVELRGDPATVVGPMAQVLGWVVRESTTNVLRHAHASQVRIGLEPQRLRVEDDGDGPHGPEGNGIRGMRERVALAGGSLAVGESSWGGTSVEVTW